MYICICIMYSFIIKRCIYINITHKNINCKHYKVKGISTERIESYEFRLII